MKHITLLPRRNKLGVVYAEEASLSAPSWHNLPDAFTGTGLFTNAPQFAEYIREVCSDALNDSVVTLCLGADLIPALMFSHPKVSAGDIKKMRANEFESVFPDGKNTMYSDDFSLYGGVAASDGKFRKIIYAMQKQYVDAMYEACNHAGVPLKRIAPFSALFQESAKKLCVEKNGVLFTEGEYKAAVYMGEYDSALAVFKGENTVFVRTLDAVAADLTENVEDLLKKTGAEAREIITNLGIDEDKKVGDDMFWLRERILLYFRDIASSSARAVNATLSKEDKLSYVMLFGEYASIEGVQKRFAKVMETKVETTEERFGNIKDGRSIASDYQTAVLSAPYYAAFSMTGVNLLNNIEAKIKLNKKLKTASIVSAAVAVVLMLILPVMNIITGSTAKKAQEKLQQPQYTEAESLRDAYEEVSAKYENQKKTMDNLPHGTTNLYDIISALNDLTDAYGTVQSVSLSGSEKCSVSVSFSSYDLATQWKHAVDNNDIFSFYGSPAISGGGGYSISCELSIDFPEEDETQEENDAKQDDDETEATEESTEEAEETTEEITEEASSEATMDELLEEYNVQ